MEFECCNETKITFLQEELQQSKLLLEKKKNYISKITREYKKNVFKEFCLFFHPYILFLN